MIKKLYILAIVAVICIAFSNSIQEVYAQPSESELKAAFLFNFTKFVHWPPDSLKENDSVFVIGILGENPFRGLLKNSVEGKQIKKQQIKVRTISDPDSLLICKVLFVCASEKDNYESILEEVANRPILTVGERDDFADAGGIIGFYMNENRVRFKINVKAAAQADLNISSKLLKLAKLK